MSTLSRQTLTNTKKFGFSVKVQEEGWTRGKTIGRGSYGTVSLAVNKSNHAVFAVKSVKKSSCLPPHRIEALENEIRILSSVSSPYVVEYLGDGVTVEERNLYMEYLPGGTVADLARSWKPRGAADVDESIIKNYAFCIVSALGYLHSKGIVHCDIKSDNILVGPTPGTAKLVDFGSAMEISTPQTKSNTAKILPRGSPLWMAPEVIRGEYQGPESDVWSFGCTVIEMVTGEPAWEDKGPAETLCRIGYSNELPRLPAQLSESGSDFLEKCLQRDPNQRWSCDQLLQHPFILMSSPANLASHSSPRSILQWFNSDSDEDEEEETVSTSLPLPEERKFNDQVCSSKLKDRIRELDCGTGANWESDGWVAVRSLDTETDEVSDGECCNDEGEGTSSEYSEWSSIEGEITGASLEYKDSIGIGEPCRRTSSEYFLDSNSSLSPEGQNDIHNDVFTTNPPQSPSWNGYFGTAHYNSSNFLLLSYFLLSKFYVHNYKICTQSITLMGSIKSFCYIFLCKSVCYLSLCFLFWA